MMFRRMIGWGSYSAGTTESAAGSRLALALSLLLLVLGAQPARAGVVVDLHYQGLDEIELSDLPADGRITLDVDISWDGVLPGLIGLGVSTFFDVASADFVGGTANKSTIFANASGANGLSVYGPPKIYHYEVAPGYAHIWPINQVTTVQAIRNVGLPDRPRTETSVYSLTFDVHDVATFDLAIAEEDGVIFRTSYAQPQTWCVMHKAAAGATYDEAECIAAGLITFDGFRVVDGARSAPSPAPIFNPEPNVGLLVGLGLAVLSLGRRSAARREPGRVL